MNMKNNFVLSKLGLLAALALFAGANGFVPFVTQAQDNSIPDRPEKLTFPPLQYEPPNPADYRVPLKSGPIAYVVPDKELPLINIHIFVRVGEYLEPAGKEGLAN